MTQFSKQLKEGLTPNLNLLGPGENPERNITKDIKTVAKFAKQELKKEIKTTLKNINSKVKPKLKKEMNKIVKMYGEDELDPSDLEGYFLEAFGEKLQNDIGKKKIRTTVGEEKPTISIELNF